MPGALNIFQTTLIDVTTTANSVYTTPLGYTTVVLMSQVANTGNITLGITAGVLRGSNTTSLAANIQLPPQDAIGLTTGRLILQYGDSFQISATANSSAQLTLSYLETLVQ
jgi:hypothetical protein